MMQISICRSCPLGQTGFANSMSLACQSLPFDTTVQEVDCMSGCTRPSAVAFRVSGKVAYLFGDLSPGDLVHLLDFAKLYHASPDGNFADARVLGPLRLKALARIPG